MKKLERSFSELFSVPPDLWDVASASIDSTISLDRSLKGLVDLELEPATVYELAES